uniref:Uncharacterized protein n=1 Tax=Strigamia maritima TaxID=126957 RepID=T1J6W2_STRMM
KTRTKDKYRVVYSDIQRLELEKEFHYTKERKQVKKREELVQKEKDIVVHHHLQPLQMSTANGIGNKMISLD